MPDIYGSYGKIGFFFTFVPKHDRLQRGTSTLNTNMEIMILLGNSQSMEFTDMARLTALDIERYNLYKFMTAYNIYRFANWNSNNHSMEALWARRHPLVCSLHLGCLPCLHTDALDLLLKAVVWVVELGGKPLLVELVPWSSIANPVLLNQGFKAISRCSERPFLFRQQWKIIWIDPDP